MTGMETVVLMRRRHVKPSAVFVDLVDFIGGYDAEEFAFDETNGIVNVNIGPDDSVADTDFRPLIGLRVHLHDHTGDTARLKRAARAIVAIEPSHLIVAMWNGDNLTVHQRWTGDPARTESVTL